MTCTGIFFCFAMLRIFAFRLIALLTEAPPDTAAGHFPHASSLHKSRVCSSPSSGWQRSASKRQEMSPYLLCCGCGSYRKLFAQGHMQALLFRQVCLVWFVQDRTALLRYQSQQHGKTFEAKRSKHNMQSWIWCSRRSSLYRKLFSHCIRISRRE